jgi:uncharacterized integral membrane protein
MGSIMRNFLKLLLLAPIVVIFLSFDMANRQKVVISFDPFNSADAILPQITVPLYVVLLSATAMGVLIGGIATWLGQGRYRKAARGAKGVADKLRLENETLRAQIQTLKASAAAPATATAIAPAQSAA